jgi:hypothetical protein
MPRASLMYSMHRCRYVSKSEPSAQVPDTDALREREGCSPQVRFLVARKVGAPEAIFTLAGWNLREGENVTHLETRPPARRRRALARCAANGDDGGDGHDGDGSLPLRFADGQLEQYMKRPRRAAAILSGCRIQVTEGSYAGREGIAAKWQAVTQKRGPSTSCRARVALPQDPSVHHCKCRFLRRS